MRLLIAIPCADVIRYEFAESLSKLQVRLSEEGVDYEVKWLAGSLIYMARDELAMYAVDGFTHVLWLDSDMIFSPDIFFILKAANKPFVTGIYRSRRSPYAICLMESFKIGTRVIQLQDQPFEVEGCGFGIVLMETECLRMVRKQYQTCFLPTLAAGEDFAFCIRYREMGGHIYAVPDARASHVANVELRCDDPTKLVEYKELR